MSKIHIICGSTASGKSAYAMELAFKTNGVIINADSMQIYKETPILSAIPTKQDMDKVEHRLYAIENYINDFSVAKWLNLAIAEINKTKTDGKTPIITGGTGMYIKYLIEGISEIPEISENSRNKARKLYEDNPEEAFNIIKKLDSEHANKLGLNNNQRICRFLEVYFETGKSITYFHNIQKPYFDLNDFEITYIKPTREQVYKNCDERFLQMVELGAIDEVTALMKNDDITDFKKVHGVAQIREYLLGNISLDEAISKSQQITRNYAKRQFTWFNNQMKYDIGFNVITP